MRASSTSIRLTVVTLLLAYIATTGLGAATFPFAYGRHQLAAFFYPQPVEFDQLTTLGSPLYWGVLLSFALVPLTALAGWYAASRAAPSFRLPPIPIIIPITLAALISAYCIYRLAAEGALSAQAAWDRSLCYEDKILRRVALIKSLGTTFYGLTYSALPVLGCYLLARAVTLGERAALIASLVVSLLVLWFDVAILFKSPAVIYLGMIGLTLWLSGVGFVQSFGLSGAAAVVVYAALSVLQFCDTQTKSWDITPPSITLEAQKEVGRPPLIGTPPEPSNPQAPVPTRTPTLAPLPAPLTDPDQAWINKAGYMVRAALLRVAAGVPFYIETFSDPELRCGIIHPERWLSPAACFPPIVVFRRMYPHITYAEGFQSASLNVMAYAESGPFYVIISTTVCGLMFGFFAAMARDRSPLSAAITLASCVWAYYATQSSFTGSLLDSYGLVWLILPIALMVATALIMRRLEREA